MTAGDDVSFQIIRQICEKLSDLGPWRVWSVVKASHKERITYLSRYELGDGIRLG